MSRRQEQAKIAEGSRRPGLAAILRGKAGALYQVDDDPEAIGSWTDFQRENPDPEFHDTLLNMAALVLGETLTVGGGAVPDMIIRRVR